MSNRYPGGFLTGDTPTVDTASADGIWTLEQQAAYQGQGVWPPNSLISRSLRFNSADTTYLSWNPPQAGNRKTWTWSGWAKRSGIGSQQKMIAFGTPSSPSAEAGWTFNANDTVEFYQYTSGYQIQLVTTQVFRDVSSWYHIVIAVDTPQATASNRVKIYVNGEQVTAFSTATYPSQNFDTYVNNTSSPNFIGNLTGQSYYFNGYITEVNLIDGLALDPSYFGQINSAGVWSPLRYRGDYGTNGFYLPFSDNSAALNLGLSAIPYTSDQGWNRTSLLLKTNGVDQANNNEFLDSSTPPKTITRNPATGPNAPTQGRFSPFAAGWSNYFDGSGDYLTFSSSPLALGTSAYTIEFWVYPVATNASGSHVIAANANNGLVIIYNNAKVALNQYNVGDKVAYNTALTLNTWTHVAIVREGTGTDETKIYINGSLAQTGTDSTNWTVTTNTALGANSASNGQYVNGYVSNFRIVTSAVYTAAFTPSTSPLTAITNTSLLTCQSNRFVDNSTNNFTITRNGDVKVTAFNPFTPTQDYSASVNGGSGYFDGSGDYLSIANNTALQFGTGDFIFETWVYPTNLQASKAAGERSVIDTGVSGFYVSLWTGSVHLASWNVADLKTFAAPEIRNNTWAHIVISRVGTSVRCFVNGVQVDTTVTLSTNFNSTGSTFIGSSNALSLQLQGYISGMKITKGSGVSSVTLPIAPPDPTGSNLCLNFTNAGIVDASGKNDIETVGDAQVDTAVTKWGSSMKFDGTGDWCYMPFNNDFNFGLGAYTWEAWVYPNVVDVRDGLFAINPGSGNTQKIVFHLDSGVPKVHYNGFTNGTNLYTSATSSLSASTWSHIAFVRKSDGTWTWYINGVASGTGSNSTDITFSAAHPTFIGYGGEDYFSAFNGYIEDLRITKGLARYTGNFTVPDAPFAYDKSDINYKQWQPNNFYVGPGTTNAEKAGIDSLVDTPTPYGTDTGVGGEVRGNYATMNPLDKSVDMTMTDGNLRVTSTNSSYNTCRATFGISSGKFYWEVTINGSGTAHGIGVCDNNKNLGPSDTIYLGSDANDYAYWRTGLKANNKVTASYGDSYTTNDILGVALDMDAGTITFYKNGVSQGQAYSGLSGTLFPTLGDIAGDDDVDYTVNFGQRPFAYTAPSGFKALCTQNLPTPSVVDGGDYFNTVLYTGDGEATRTITLPIETDFLWTKNRTTANDHVLIDTVRGGTSPVKALFSNSTGAELTTIADWDNYGYPDSLSGTSYGIVKGTQSTSYTNKLNDNYVVWCWNAGGSNATNTDGTITSTVRANTTAGFSIVAYDGAGTTATVGHGLGVVPDLYIIKRRTGGTENWYVYTQKIDGSLDYLLLNTTADKANSAASDPTSTVFSVSSAPATGASGSTYIAYCFAEVEGYSKFGSYIGNGSTDGPFVYCGFRPAFVMIKRTDTTTNWLMRDVKRDPYNQSVTPLAPNLALGESSFSVTLNETDILSNGFKLRDNYTDQNASGGTYIFMAFAENPFKYSLAR